MVKPNFTYQHASLHQIRHYLAQQNGVTELRGKIHKLCVAEIYVVLVKQTKNAMMSDSLQSQTLQDRLDRVRELTEFTEKCQQQLRDIFKALGWSEDYKTSKQVGE